MALKGSTIGEQVYNYLYDFIGNHFGASALWGNLKAESGVIPNNVENGKGFTDEDYTTAVDNGTYTNFVNDRIGYGLAQWTHPTRKKALFDFIRQRGKSISDTECQLDYLKQELTKMFPTVLAVLKSAKSVREASDIVLAKFEVPAGWNTEKTQVKRAAMGMEAYNTYAKPTTTAKEVTIVAKCYASKVLAVAIGEIGYHEKATNANLADKTANAGTNDFTKYANYFDTECPSWYNGKKNGYAWCDMFVDWCFHMAYGHEDALRLLCQPEKSAGAGCTYSYKYYKQKGQVGKTPKIGAQIFFGYSESHLTHTGIVEKFDSKYVYTIEGNTSSKVARRTYSINAANIFGYGYPAYDGEGTVTSTPVQAPTQTTSTNTTISEVKATGVAHKLDRSIAGTYKTTDGLNVRHGAGTNNASMVVLPKGISVKNYGYYSVDSSGTKWLYIQVTYNNIKYTGFSSIKYLSKQ